MSLSSTLGPFQYDQNNALSYVVLVTGATVRRHRLLLTTTVYIHSTVRHHCGTLKNPPNALSINVVC